MARTHLSNLFELLHAAFEMPTPSNISRVTSGQLRDDMRLTWLALELPTETIDEYCQTMDAYVGMEEKDALEDIRMDHSRMFLNPQKLANCEGVYRKKAEGQDQVFFMINSYSTEVSDFMYHCGVVKKEGYNDSMDLIENEWLFCSMLAKSPDYLAERGISAEEKLEEFIENHLRLWIPSFSKDLESLAGSNYYQALARLQAVLIEYL